jgi:hypothetical protein
VIDIFNKKNFFSLPTSRPPKYDILRQVIDNWLSSFRGGGTWGEHYHCYRQRSRLWPLPMWTPSTPMMKVRCFSSPPRLPRSNSAFLSLMQSRIFVTGVVPEDHGFALQPWSAVRFENAGIIIDADSAVAMGNYFFTDANTGKEAKAEFTFGYVRGTDGKLLINVHHSAFPYQPSH